jgi:hypothetical protein
MDSGERRLPSWMPISDGIADRRCAASIGDFRVPYSRADLNVPLGLDRIAD